MSTGQIETTLGALVEAEATLGRVAAVKFDKEGGAKVRYHVAKLVHLVTTETKHFYEDRNKLVEQYGEGEPKKVDPASLQFKPFLAAVKELTDVPVKLSWGPLTSAMLDPYPDVTAADWFTLGPLFAFTENGQP